MSKGTVVDLSRYGGVQGTKMTPDHLEGDAAVLTIKEFGEQKNSGEGRQVSPVLRYQECPDLLHYLNRTMLEQIVFHYGPNTATWIGRKVPVEVKDVPYEGQTFRKVVIADAQEWGAIFTEAGLNADGSDKSASKVAATAKPKVKGTTRGKKSSKK